jgi:hypothetical protein
MALERLRSSGVNPQTRPETKSKNGQANALHAAQAREWDGTEEHPDPAWFAAETLPAIQAIPVRRLAEATGLSALYCSQIRRGLRVPHPRHWNTLLILVRQVPT